jgi:hypothetical protein
MFFLLRMAFWLGVVCVLLPGSGSQPDEQIDATQAVTLASAAVSDARGFCERQREACRVGGRVVTALGHKAEAGARTLFQFITARLSDHSTPTTTSAPEVTTGGVPRVVPVTAAGNGTLEPADLQPAWHAPVPLPPRRVIRTGSPSV